jgi:hypothetical protein
LLVATTTRWPRCWSARAMAINGCTSPAEPVGASTIDRAMFSFALENHEKRLQNGLEIS